MSAVDNTGHAGIDSIAMWKHVEKLSSYERVAGTPGERAAADYIMSVLRDDGVPAQRFTIDAFISHPLEAELEILSPERFTVPCRPSSFATGTPAGGIEAEVVFLGSSKDRAERGSSIYAHQSDRAAEYDEIDVKGKIVLSTDGGPDGVRSAELHGAVAHGHVWPSGEDVLHERIVTPIWGTPTPDSIGRLPKIPAIALKHADGDQIRQLAEKGKVCARLKASTHTAWMPIQLMVATIDGALDPTDFVLVGGHVCSWFYGATDNATGNACLLEMARLLYQNRQTLRRSVRIAWWPGHSQGRYAGSTWYADNYFMELRRHCVAYLNIDSPGIGGAEDWECRLEHGEIEQFVKETVIQATGKTPSLRRPNKASDQSFWGIGVPSLGAYHVLPAKSPLRGTVGGSGGGYWWHSPEDTLDKADARVLAEDTALYMLLTTRLCNDECLPFEFVTSARDFLKSLTDLSRVQAGVFDLSPALDAAHAFEASAAKLEAVRGNVMGGNGELYNRVLMRTSRIINPVLYTVAGDYEQDPALQTPLLPGLQPVKRLAKLDPASDGYRFLMTRLVRERNRVEDALNRATDEINRFLEELA